MTKHVLGPSGLPKGACGFLLHMRLAYLCVSDYEARRNPDAPSTLFTLTGEAHLLRRRKWNKAMNSESLAAYSDVIGKRVIELVDHLSTLRKESEDTRAIVNIDEWLSWLS